MTSLRVMITLDSSRNQHSDEPVRPYLHVEPEWQHFTNGHAMASHDELTPRYSPGPNVVHIWRLSLDLTAGHLVNLQRLLSKDEHIRAMNFRTEQLRDRFVAGRGSMRVLLGEYTGISPEALVFQYGGNGKPCLAGLRSPVEFNLTHSKDLALFAVAQRCVGIDMECFRQDIEMEDMASLVLSSHEQSILHAAPEHVRLKVFFSLWTRKEAFMKATGQGISDQISQFTISHDANWIIERELSAIPGEHVAPWCLYDIPMKDDAAAALVVAGNHHQIRYFEFEGSLD